MAARMKNELMYGYPISSILLRIIGLIILLLLVFYMSLSFPPFVSILSYLTIPLAFYIFIIRFRIHFSSVRKKIVHEMIQRAHLKGNEKILDIGTGSGYIAIHFAKEIHSGSVIGIDKYDLKDKGLFHWFLDELKINFFGNSLANAKKMQS